MRALLWMIYGQEPLPFDVGMAWGVFWCLLIELLIVPVWFVWKVTFYRSSLTCKEAMDFGDPDAIATYKMLQEMDEDQLGELARRLGVDPDAIPDNRKFR